MTYETIFTVVITVVSLAAVQAGFRLTREGRRASLIPVTDDVDVEAGSARTKIKVGKGLMIFAALFWSLAMLLVAFNEVEDGSAICIKLGPEKAIGSCRGRG